MIKNQILIRFGATIMSKVKSYETLKITGATLLPYKVATKLSRQLLSIKMYTHWWLKDWIPNEFNYVGVSDYVGQLGGTAITQDFAVRPVLKLDNSATSIVGKQFRIAEYTFTIITPRYALIDEPIGISMYGVFERQSKYANSVIKEVVDNWYKTIKDQPIEWV